MAIRLFFSLPTLFIFLLSGNLHAQTDFDPLGEILEGSEKQIRIQAEWIEISHEALTELLSKDRRLQPEGMQSSNDQPLRDEITELIKKDQGKIIETTVVIARSGNRAKAESVMEFIYPTEYMFPPKSKVDPGEKKETKTEKESAPAISIPTAFEVRNLGTTLEVDPVLGVDGRTIDLNVAPELVYNTGFENYGEHNSGGSRIEIKMPKFYMAKVTTQVTVINGEYLMVGVVSPRNMETGESDASRKLLLFLKADILACGLPIEKK